MIIRAKDLPSTPRGLELPFAIDALEVVDAAIVERDFGADDEVSNRPGDEDLAGFGFGQDASADVHRQPADPVAAQLELARVQPGSDRQRDALELPAKV